MPDNVNKEQRDVREAKQDVRDAKQAKGTGGHNQQDVKRRAARRPRRKAGASRGAAGRSARLKTPARDGGKLAGRQPPPSTGQPSRVNTARARGVVRYAPCCARRF